MLKYFYLLILLYSTHAFSQDAYKWKDSEGRIIYGTKPPKTNQSVESFSTRKLSTYSENKVLKSMGKEPKAKPPEFNIEKADPKTRAGFKSINKPDRKERSNVSEVLLKSELPKLSFNDKDQISSCTVIVQNHTDSHAFEISVAFEFPDGTLIPAAGPFELESKSEAEFYIPNELLPLDKKLGQELGDLNQEDNQKNAALPKVILHSLGSTAERKGNR